MRKDWQTALVIASLVGVFAGWPPPRGAANQPAASLQVTQLAATPAPPVQAQTDSSQEVTAPPSTTEDVGVAEFRAWSSDQPEQASFSLYFSKANFRLISGPSNRLAVMIGSFVDPQEMYRIEGSSKEYWRASNAQLARSRYAGQSYGIQKSGDDVVAGIRCRKVRVAWSNGDSVEGCLAPDIAASNEWLLAYTLFDYSVLGALKANGLDGLAVRWETREASGTRTLQLAKFERTSQPASTFALPPDYAELGPLTGRGCGDAKAPVLIHRVEPAYPAKLRRQRVQGTVIVEGIVALDGSVTDVKVLKSVSADLDKSAIQAVSQWQYTPAYCVSASPPLRAYYPVRVYVTVRMAFSLHSR